MVNLYTVEYKWDKQATAVAGLGFAVGGLVLTIAFPLMPESENIFLLPWILLLFLVSICCLTAERAVKLDLRARKLFENTGVVLLSRSREYRFSDFEGVQICRYMTGSFDDHGPDTFYYVKLIGRKNVSIPRPSGDIEGTCRKGREIAELMGLPLISQPMDSLEKGLGYR